MHLLAIILDDLEKLPALLASWREIGVGATLVDSQGGYRVSSWLDRVGLGGINRLLGGQRIHPQRLVLSLILDNDLLEQAVARAEQILEGFHRPKSGILFVLPVGRILGLDKPLTGQAVEEPASPQRRTGGIDPRTTVSEALEILGLEPSVVRPDDPISRVVEVMRFHPSVNVVGVINEEDRLIGLIDTTTLSEILFFLVFPGSFIAELHDRQTVLEFFKRPHDAKTAGDIMQPPEFIHTHDTLYEAFRVLQQRKLEGIPVLDSHNKVTGYIHLIDLMAMYVQDDVKGEGAEDPDDL
jgi:CBS domain-containing protein